MIDQYADKYKKTGASMYQIKVLNEAESYINHIVSKINVPKGVRYEYDDLNQEARIMVIKSLENYDASRDNKFSTYMYIRVFGGVIQYIRNQDPLSRGKRNEVGKIRKHRHTLEQLLGRTPSDSELAESLGVPLKDIRESLVHEVSRDRLSMDREDVPYPHMEDTVLMRKFDREFLMEKLKTLPVKDRVIMICTYYLNMEAKETAKLMDYSNRHYIYNLKRKILDHLQTLVS